MSLLSILFAPLLLVQSAAAPPITMTPAAVPELTGEERYAFDCAVTVGLLAKDQRDGVVGADHWPVVGEKEREYFVRYAAQLMDRYAIGRLQMAELVSEATSRLVPLRDQREEALPACLALIEASGL